MGLRVFITGATGAIGPDVLAALLCDERIERVDALIRPGDGLTSRERFDGLVDAVRCAMPSAATRLLRLRAVAGDVREQLLGIDRQERAALWRETDVVIHAAADTGFRVRPERQHDVNVGGTRRALDFAARCRGVRRFVLVSTTCAAGTNSGLIPEAPIVHPPEFVNGYERSKWEAEGLALGIRPPADPAFPVRVVRLSTVIGSSGTGGVRRPGALHHALRWLGLGLVPLVPGTPRTPVDFITSEAAGLAVARAAMADDAAGRVWHAAAGARAVPLQELLDFATDAFAAHGPGWRRGRLARPAVVDRAAFDLFRQSVRQTRDALFGRVLDSVESFLPALLYPKTCQTAAAEAACGGTLAPRDWRDTVGRVIATLARQPGDERAAPASREVCYA